MLFTYLYITDPVDAIYELLDLYDTELAKTGENIFIHQQLVPIGFELISTNGGIIRSRMFNLNLGEILNLAITADYYRKFQNGHPDFKIAVGVREDLKNDSEYTLVDGNIVNPTNESRMAFQQTMAIKAKDPTKLIKTEDVISAINNKSARADNYPSGCALIIIVYGHINPGEIVSLDFKQVIKKANTHRYSEVICILHELPNMMSCRIVRIYKGMSLKEFKSFQYLLFLPRRAQLDKFRI